VEQAVRSLLELDERAELSRLDDLRIEKLVSDLRLFVRASTAAIADAAFCPSVA